MDEFKIIKKYFYKLAKKSKSSLDLNDGYGIQLSVNSTELLNKIGFKNLNSLSQFNPKKIFNSVSH